MYFHTVESWNIQIDLGPLDPASCQGTAHVFQAAPKYQIILILLTKRNHVTVEEFALTRICIWIFLDAHTTSMDGIAFATPEMQKLPLLEGHGTLFLPHFLQVCNSVIIPQDRFTRKKIHYFWVWVLASSKANQDMQIDNVCRFILCCHSYLINKLHFNCRPLLVYVHIWSKENSTRNFKLWLLIWAADSSFRNFNAV